MSVVLCHCQAYRRIAQEKIEAVHAACEQAAIPCVSVPDLCYLAAKDTETLRCLEGAEVVLACQPRAARALFPSAVRYMDIRTESVETVLAAICAVPVAPVVCEPHMPSSWVPWFPVIDYSRCVQCKKCVDFCLFGVFAVEGASVSVVQPDHCKTDCPACARICPQNAIIFPKSEEPRLNGALDEPVMPSPMDRDAFRERLKHRKLRLFKEDD
ncbi:MAG: hypothetical protein IJU44_04360 [Kiritimatiellae bacterium]|nr:hypothetical protein [Kiritimatiellia bacterium]